MEILRTFIAIELEDATKSELRRVQSELAGQLPARSVRWVQLNGIHLTLKFLGDTPLGKVEAVKTALAQAAAEVIPFRIIISGLGCFPNARQPRVVWVGLQELSGGLIHLHKAVEAYVAPLGFPTEKRPFSPHLTLGRVQQSASLAEARQIGEAVITRGVGTLGEMQASAVSYIRSDLRPTGAVYTTLSEARLGRERESAHHPGPGGGPGFGESRF